MSDSAGLWSPSFLLMIFSGLISIPVYIATIVVILWKKNVFRGSFFHLYIALALVNISIYFLRYFITRMPVLTCRDCAMSLFFQTAPEYFVRTVLALFYHCMFAQCLLIGTIALDRFLVLRGTKKIAELWKRIYSYFIALGFLLPFLISQAVFLGSASYSYEPLTDSYEVISSSFQTVYLIFNIFAVGTIPIGLLMNILVILSVMKGEMKLSNKQRMTEVKLFINSALDTFLQILGASLMILQMFFSSNPVVENVLRKMIIFEADALGLLSPFVLLFTSGQLRRAMRSCFQRKKKIVITSSTEHRT